MLNFIPPMLKNHLTSVLRENLPYDPTPAQERLMNVLAEFIASTGERECLLVKGFAGTGKTTLVHALVRTLDQFRIRSVLMAPTGRAAKVLSSYAGKKTYTIHKEIYRQKGSREGLGTFVLDRNLFTDTFFVVDEASMISNQSAELSLFGSGRLLDDLIEYVYSGRCCRLILMGDSAQLPPVGLDISPALDIRALEGYGLRVREVFLDDIIRQALGSGILSNATDIRKMIDASVSQIPVIRTRGLPDVEHISGRDLIEALDTAYGRDGVSECIVICRSNRQANRYNQGIRNQIFYREEEISMGDILMVVKNNYFWLQENEVVDFIANGDMMEVARIHGYRELYGTRFADLELRFLDYREMEIRAWVMLETLTADSPSLPSPRARELYQAVLEDYPHARSQRKKFLAVRSDPFFNALQVKFGYAVTCHKAQGGQWKHVFVDQGYMTDDRVNTEYLRWLYTAFTRASEKLYLVNFPAVFLENG